MVAYQLCYGDAQSSGVGTLKLIYVQELLSTHKNFTNLNEFVTAIQDA